MNDASRYRTLWIAVAGLLLINLGILGWIWRTSSDDRRQGPPRLFLENELNFTDEQKEEFKKLRDEHFPIERIISDSVRYLKKQLFLKISDTTLADAQLAQMALAVEKRMVQSDVRTFRHLQQVRKMCTPEQRRKFDEILERIIDQGDPGRRRPPSEMPPPP